MDEWQTVRKGAGSAGPPPVIPLSRSTTAPTPVARGFTLLGKDRKAQTPTGKDEPSWRGSQGSQGDRFNSRGGAAASSGAAEEQDFSKDIQGIISDLQYSHDIADAVWRIKELRI